MSSVLSELGSLHARFVHGRRTRALSEHLAPLLPAHANVLDVGCGDGLVASRIGVLRPDVTLVGLDISLRPVTHIPVSLFDGQHLPVEDGSFDAVMLVDVLHHTDDPIALLREAGRASAGIVLVKDHTLDGFLAGVRLRGLWTGLATLITVCHCPTVIGPGTVGSKLLTSWVGSWRSGKTLSASMHGPAGGCSTTVFTLWRT